MLQGNCPGKIFSPVGIVLVFFRGKRDFPREKFSMGEFSAAEIFHGRIFYRRTFPSAVEGCSYEFYTKGDSHVWFDNNKKLNNTSFFFQMKIG